VVARASNPTAFVLAPLTAGPAKRDSGIAFYCCVHSRDSVRDGESLETARFLKTYQGQRGTFVLRIVVEWAEAGNGYTIGSGSWNVVHGTGAYAHLAGNGRLAVVASSGSLNDISWRAEGYVHS
jgi:hypothetical protein